eukprot:7265901-Lingulodinium_polyedra.AAC.1
MQPRSTSAIRVKRPVGASTDGAREHVCNGGVRVEIGGVFVDRGLAPQYLCVSCVMSIVGRSGLAQARSR